MRDVGRLCCNHDTDKSRKCVYVETPTPPTAVPHRDVGILVLSLLTLWGHVDFHPVTMHVSAKHYNHRSLDNSKKLPRKRNSLYFELDN